MIPFPEADVEGSLAARFEAVAAAVPEAPALVFDGKTTSYGELNARANRWARVLRGAGDRELPTPLLLGHGDLEITALLACLKAQAPYSVLDPSVPLPRLREIATNLGASDVVATAPQLPLAQALSLPVVDLGAAAPETPDSNLELSGDPGGLASIVYTSGSTGAPKGAMRSQRCLLHRAWLFANAHDVGPGDRIAHMFASGFVASEVDVFGALLSGAALCIYPTRTLGVGPLAEWLVRERVTILHPPPALFRRFLDGLDGPLPGSSLRNVGLGGEAASRHDIERIRRAFPGCTIAHRFSSSETSVLTRLTLAPDAALGEGALPAGHPVPGKSIRLVDASGTPVAEGEIGEVEVRSRYLADGYWRDPELTASRFRVEADGVTRVFRTGDLGRWLPDGMLQHAGRSDGQVKVRGYRIELSEVESKLRALEEVREAVVVAPTGARGERRLVAWVVPTEAAAFDAVAVRRRLAETLPQFMLPSRFEAIPELPVLRSGKIDRHALANRAADERLSPLPRSAGDSVDGLEFQVRLLWNDIMGRRDIGLHDDFFDLGGDSILAAELMLSARRLFGREPALVDFVAEPTVAAMARQLRGGRPTEDFQFLVPLRASGTAPPFICVHPDTGSALHFVNLVRHLDPDVPFYALQARGMDGCGRPHDTLDEMADAYLEEVRRIQPHGPYHLGGRCLGGQIAAEMARRLLADGEEVAIVAVIDAYGPHVARLGRRTRLRVRRAVRRWLGRERTLPTDAPVRARMKRSRKRHRPAPFPGHITLFWAGEDEKGNLAGWHDLAEGRVDLVTVPGDHHSILREPHVAELAARLGDRLSKARSARFGTVGP